MGWSDETTTKLFTNEMAVNLDVFGAFMENKILGNVEHSLVVVVKVHGRRMRNSDVGEQRTEPSQFTRSRGHGTVFSFGRRTGDSGFFLDTPRNRTSVKLNKKTSGGATSSRTASPIKVEVGGDLQTVLSRIKEALSSGGCEG